jgi:hypothetical protein
MGASLHLATSNSAVPVAGDDGYIDLTSLTGPDWVRMGARVYGDDFIKLGIDELDEMLTWLKPSEYALSKQKSRQSPTFSEYNAVIEVLPPDHQLDIRFSFRGHRVEIQVTDNKGRKRWEDCCSHPLDRVPTRAAKSALLKRRARTLFGSSVHPAWPALLDHYFDILEIALEKLVIKRADLMDQENIDELVLTRSHSAGNPILMLMKTYRVLRDPLQARHAESTI